MLEADMVIRINSLMRKRLPFSLTAIDIQKVLLIMRGRCDSKGLAGGDCRCALLPTRQRNTLRLLLDKRIFTPEEIAALDYHVVERAPRIGKNGLAVIRSWLNSYGHELDSPPVATRSRKEQCQNKIERAINYLRWHGYEVYRSR